MYRDGQVKCTKKETNYDVIILNMKFWNNCNCTNLYISQVSFFKQLIFTGAV